MTPMALTTAALLVLLVGGCWVAAVAMLRLGSVLDRVHAVGFVTVFGSLCLLGAAAFSDGATPRLAKVALIVVANLLAGAAGSHLMGRAVHARGEQ